VPGFGKGSVEAAESGHRPGERGEVTGAGRGKQEIVKEAGVGLGKVE
jgi:hypothetical protein